MACCVSSTLGADVAKKAIIALAIFALTACDEEGSGPATVIDTAGTPIDLGFVDAGATDRPVPSLCGPGTRRCVAENNPIYEECRDNGKGWARKTCDAGDICQSGRCVAFSCNPGRDLCVGAERRAVCDAAGTGVTNLETCPSNTVCRAGTCFDLCAAAEASDSYIGCEYTAHRNPNYYDLFPQGNDTDNAPFAVVVANPDPLLPLEAEVKVGDQPAKVISSVTLTPGPFYAFSERTTVRSQVLRPFESSFAIRTGEPALVPAMSAAVFLLDRPAQTFKVTSTRPSVVSQYSPYCCNFTATNDASLLLPDYALGQRYRVVGYPSLPDSGFRPYVRVIANVSTTVTVESQVPVLLNNADRSEVTIPAGGVLSIELNTPTDSSQQDLTGLQITADNPVAAFTGHPCTFVPQDQWACDHLEEQLLPAETLGRSYILVPTRQRAEQIRDKTTEATYWRIVADEDAVITLDPPLEELNILPPSNTFTADCASRLAGGAIQLQAGAFCEFGTRQPTTVSSTGDLIIAGIISGHESTGVRAYGTQAGDPSMFILPPVEQFRRDYSFVSPPTFKRSYVSLAIPTDAAVALDGRSLDESARLERREVTLDGRSYEVFNVAVDSGVHRIEADASFGIVVYAYDDYVSYAFTGGLDLVPKGSN